MICPGTEFDCDNPGCRHGGCQGRRPSTPAVRLNAVSPNVQVALVALRARSHGITVATAPAIAAVAAAPPVAGPAILEPEIVEPANPPEIERVAA